ncbi:Long-chain fatty acid--CoA ligase [Sulfidibacter corallicola]|uniref:Long-chain fatty acid--CoA ligase n=1 Tax=Sulfidibacter corallicola TaxID=2818388 RepID=A0A8A4TQ37_SULCO|nr:long-chain fatty acid--CoA ligase [Sulfidibacter corallicola]QTD52096.1 long-chain fatty acid--CoA ligase [Sulfidibacter corallicola]
MQPQSIPQLFFDACQQFDKREAVLVKQDGEYAPFSHRFFRQRVDHFARGLIALGLEVGEHVAILAPTRWEWAIADLAIICGGGVVVPVYPTLGPAKIGAILDHAHCVGVVVADASLAEQALSLREQLPNLRFVISMDGADLPEGVHHLPEVEIEGSRHDNEHEMVARWQSKKPEDLLTIVYTSGTQGDQKGVMLTHGNMIANIRSCEPFMNFGPEDICLSHLPLSHVLERMAGYYTMLYRGVTIAYTPTIQTLVEDMEAVRPTVLISVPRVFEKLYARVLRGINTAGFLKRNMANMALGVGREALPYLINGAQLPSWLSRKYRVADRMVFSKIHEKTGGRLKLMVSGGAPLPRKVTELFLGIGFKVIEGYGLTEAAPVLTINRPDKNRPGTVGPPIPEVEIRIAEDGEILARGPNVMPGYYRDQEATRETLMDGWLHTGDIGVIDAEGCLRITDRKKDLIITSGGKNIAPQPLEKAIVLSPLIERAVIIGDQRPFIAAIIVPAWESIGEWAPERGWSTNPQVLVGNQAFRDTIEAEIATHSENFAFYERVRKFQMLPHSLKVETGELTPSLKVVRRVVIERYGKLVEDLYREEEPEPLVPTDEADESLEA